MTQSKHTSASVSDLIGRGRVNDAIKALKGMNLTPELLDRLHEAETVYTQMLRFFSQGAPDPGRAEVLATVSEMLHSIADSLRRRELAETSSSYYYSQIRTARISPPAPLAVLIADAAGAASRLSLADATGDYDAAGHKDFERRLGALFNALWINQRLSAQEAAALSECLAAATPDEEPGTLLSAVILSALTLSSLEYFDRRKLEILLAVYARSSHPLLGARALVGATLVLGRHGARAAAGESIRRLSLEAADRPGFRSEMRTLVAAMLHTRDTDRVNRKLTDEIIPPIMKLKPEIEKRIKELDPEELASSPEEAPEWMEMIEKSGVEDKLREFSEMQLEGADVMMGAFAAMKNFPFFREMYAWFLPFSPLQSDVRESLAGLPSALSDVMLQMPVFCASDKYSLALALSRMPAGQASMMSAHLGSQFEALGEEARATLSRKLETGLESEITFYLRDLFRFYRLSPRKTDFADPFAGAFHLPDAPLFAPVNDDEELLRLMADFLFKRAYWREAAPLYASLSASLLAEPSDAQKQGFCLEKSGDIKGALAAYRLAELLDEPSPWLIKRIAACLRTSGSYAEAASYYGRALEKEPDNMRLELLRGHSLLEAGNPAEAIKSYYKVDYLDPNGKRSLRPIAWCEFLLGNLPKSIAAYEKITAGDDTVASDFLNYGHVLFASGRIADAATAYRKSLAMSDAKTFGEQYAADASTLREKGIGEMELRLMTDLVFLG